MKKFVYDFLNVFTYLGVVFFTVLYNKHLTSFQVSHLVFIHLAIFFVVTVLQLANSLRWNLHF